MAYQHTIHHPVEIEGIGLHTAVRCRMRFMPAPANTGIVFRRVDLDNFEIAAHVDNVARVSYATSLMRQSVLISTTEHLLAALYCCGIDNIYRGAGCAGVADSGWLVAAVYRDAGACGDAEPAPAAALHSGRQAAGICDGDRRIGIYPADEFSVQCFVDYHHPAAGPKSWS